MLLKVIVNHLLTLWWVLHINIVMLCALVADLFVLLLGTLLQVKT